MPQITIITQNQKLQTTARRGESFFGVIDRAGFNLRSDCGGTGLCGKCTIRLVSGKIDGAIVSDNGDFLACRGTVDTDATVKLIGKNVQISHETESFPDIPKCVHKTQKFLKNGFIPDKSTIKPAVAVNSKQNFIDSAYKESIEKTGLALDIGTTTLSAALVDLNGGVVLGKASLLNPQSKYGADVISRIRFASEGGLSELTQIIREACANISNRLLNVASSSTHCKIAPPSVITAAGNPAMLHILAGINPKALGEYPYRSKLTKTTQIHLDEFPEARVMLLPSAGAFIGADTTAAVLSASMLNGGTSLLLDLGTNGELALYADGRLFCASAATGPAFEGAGTERGAGGVAGAICSVGLSQNGIEIQTVDDAEPCGICGAGLIDAVALMLKYKVIDWSGAFGASFGPEVADNVRGDKFYLSENEYVSQKDVRAFQLAKSAINTGIIKLAEHAGIGLESIEKVYLAGGFGCYMNVDGAIATGIIPKQFKGKIQAVGNASLDGAVAALIKPVALAQAERIAEKIEIVELNETDRFGQDYIANLNFDNQQPYQSEY